MMGAFWKTPASQPDLHSQAPKSGGEFSARKKNKNMSTSLVAIRAQTLSGNK
jgi:hypothetical protein